MQEPDITTLRIHSGGQTGVDRAALDVAIELGLEHGGWCPQGRRAEDGNIPLRYRLRETPDKDYTSRTRRNVEDADGTLVLCRGKPEGGTELTLHYAEELRKPVLIIDLAQPVDAESFKAWLRRHHIRTLNVAGPRESKQNGIYQQSFELLRSLLSE